MPEGASAPPPRLESPLRQRDELTLSDCASPLKPTGGPPRPMPSFAPGVHVVARRAGVTRTIERRDEVVRVLDIGAEVLVDEVVPYGDRIRARIVSPVCGWMSLCRETDGRSFAHTPEVVANLGRQVTALAMLTPEAIQELSGKALRALARSLGISEELQAELDPLGPQAYVRWILSQRELQTGQITYKVKEGQRVRVRDEHGQRWRLGTVVEAGSSLSDPLVRLEGLSELVFSFNIIEPIEDYLDTDALLNLGYREWRARSEVANEEHAKRHTLERKWMRRRGRRGCYRRQRAPSTAYLYPPSLPPPPEEEEEEGIHSGLEDAEPDRTAADAAAPPA
eukprot:TRINITY_DN21157_c0_g1_i1.p1 TRINITY_DN21157_c0_g1~~TRINITY_DN21157_c0_g1_i1.p1  ORF type:complete len:338 (+),score=81.97 TRINITY_DN21157_c0_g1_i1:98-1111(+)